MNKDEYSEQISPVTIDAGPSSWQILQQDADGVASVTLSGRWWTIGRRKKPEVRVRIVREDDGTPIGTAHDWQRARTAIDRSLGGDRAGRFGTWRIKMGHIPRGGPYRIQTKVGSVEDAIEWRRSGDVVNLLGVGDLWLIAGQSNAEGYGRDPAYDPPEMGVHQCLPGGWELAMHEHSHSPWPAFGKILRRDRGYPMGLIPTAVGGSAVSEWDPGQDGALFKNMKDRLAAAGGRIKGCLWYQGESDTGAGDYPHYKARFRRFVRGLRRATRRPDLPVITVQLNRVLGPRDDAAGWEAMREIQRRLAHEIDGVYIVPVFEAGLCDGIHLSSLGNLLVAQRTAAVALGAVYGRDVAYKHPECRSARRVSGATIELHFDHIVTRLDYECDVGNGFAFAVRDREGEVPVLRYRMIGGNRMRIELARALHGRATVTGAPGCCPPHIVPRDISGYRGMLGFTMDVS